MKTQNSFKSCLSTIASNNEAIQSLYEFRMEMAKAEKPNLSTWEKLGFDSNTDYFNFCANPLQYTIKLQTITKPISLGATVDKLAKSLAWSASYQEVADSHKSLKLSPPTREQIIESELYKQFYNYYIDVLSNYKET